MKRPRTISASPPPWPRSECCSAIPQHKGDVSYDQVLEMAYLRTSGTIGRIPPRVPQSGAAGRGTGAVGAVEHCTTIVTAPEIGWTRASADCCDVVIVPRQRRPQRPRWRFAPANWAWQFRRTTLNRAVSTRIVFERGLHASATAFAARVAPRTARKACDQAFGLILLFEFSQITIKILNGAISCLGSEVGAFCACGPLRRVIESWGSRWQLISTMVDKVGRGTDR